MKILRFEDIESWRESRILVKQVYASLLSCKDYGYKDQIQRAAVSIMTNIAEGFERGSNKEFVYFLTISRGSVAEVKSLAYVGLDVSYIDKQEFDLIFTRCMKLLGLINGFINYLKSTERKK
jgi:four helix bundle protein